MKQQTIKKKRPTLTSIAKEAGVSVSAVSQILNNREVNFCSEEKKLLVKKVAKKLNYQVNLGYRIMTGMNTNTVAIIFCGEYTKNEEHINHLSMLLLTSFENKGFSVYLATMGNYPEKNFQKIIELRNRGCSSFIFIGSPLGHKKIENYIEENDIDYVGFGTNEFKRNIIVDSSFAVKEFIEKFLSDGRTNFRLLMTPTSKEHERGFGLFRAFPDIDKDKLMEKYCRWFPMENHEATSEEIYRIGYEQTKQLMQMDNKITGIIYLSDYFALGGAKYLVENGYKVGEDIVLCGYNNTNAVNFYPFSISTASHSMEEICPKLITALGDKKAINQIYKPKIIIR